jgi:hypothetical protein
MQVQRRRAIRGDILASVCGALFFALSVGVEKLDPRNVSWLTFGDQQTHWLGWRFFAADSWRWPLGANPTYGWERMNSIVFTDSFPGLAIIFKAVDVDMFDKGQYFGLGFLISSIALFVGGQRLFSHLGLRFWSAIVAAALLGTTPLFWWMQRWYPALSSGVPMLVWAFYFYLDSGGVLRRLLFRWSALLLAAVATQAYLVIAVFAFFAATITQRFFKDRREFRALIGTTATIVVLCVAVMYVLGYYTVPSKWAQTGGYGWYSANLLGLIDPNESSRWVPNLPSISGQYEPTALSTGSLILVMILVGTLLVARTSFGLMTHFRQHLPLIGILFVLALIAITNTVSLGSWSAKIPLPQRLEHGLSVFRSSARFIWPTVVVLSTCIIALAARRFRTATAMLAVVLVIQVVDYSYEFNAVSKQQDGQSAAIGFDPDFWQRVPSGYTTISAHPAASLGSGWAECAYAAVQTGRSAQCGYFSRVQGLERVNHLQSEALLTGNLDKSTVYWVSTGWLRANREILVNVYALSDLKVHVLGAGAVVGSFEVLLFPNCEARDWCSFLGHRRETLGKFLRSL